MRERGLRRETEGATVTWVCSGEAATPEENKTTTSTVGFVFLGECVRVLQPSEGEQGAVTEEARGREREREREHRF